MKTTIVIAVLAGAGLVGALAGTLMGMEAAAQEASRLSWEFDLLTCPSYEVLLTGDKIIIEIPRDVSR